MDQPLVVLVTGAARGIGLEVCRQLLVQGHHVLLTARTADQAATAADGLRSAHPDAPGTVVPMALDVDSEADAAVVADLVAQSPGRLDVLVNNAARFADWTLTPTATKPDEVRAVLETGLLAPWRLTTALLPLLAASRHPRVVNVSSGSGSHGDPFGLAMPGGGAAAYSVTKAALNALTAKLAAELDATRSPGAARILVNSVCPGLTATAPGMEAMGARPVEEGAASVLWGVTLPDDGPSGGFFRDGAPLPW